MRLRLRLTAAAIAAFLWVAPAAAQVLDYGSITATSSSCTATACVSVTPGQAMSVTWQISGTFSATLAFEATSDGTNWVALQVQNAATGVISSSTTAAGAFSFTNNGYLSVRVRASAYTSGTAVVYATRGYGSVRWQGFSSITVSPGPITVINNGIGTTSTDGIVLENNTAAAAGAQQYSPRTCWEGQGWKTDATAASQSVVFCLETQPVQGSSAPSGNFILKASINGGAFSTVGTFTSGGAFTAAGTATATVFNSTATTTVLGSTANPYTITLAEWGTTLSAEGISVANDGVLFLGASPLGALTVVNVDNAGFAVYALRGGVNATVESIDSLGSFTITKDNAATTNIYYDAAGASGAGYYLQNKMGSTKTYRLTLLGA